MFKNKTYARIPASLMACAVLFFAGLSMGEAGTAPQEAPDIKEVRIQAKADIEAIYVPRRADDFVKVASDGKSLIDKIKKWQN